MIDPTNITNFSCTEHQLEELILFWVCAAGKNAITSSSSLNRLLVDFSETSPFCSIKKIGENNLPLLLKKYGIGCYNNKSRTFYELANSNLNLGECSCEDLEKIYGIGMKTSRCFIIHSRKNALCAGLDTHILKFLKMMGCEVPKSTPNKKLYLKLENEFINLVSASKRPVAEIDLLIWNYFSGHKNVKEEFLCFCNSIEHCFI